MATERGAISVTPVSLDEVRLWRDMRRLEMACQITKDSVPGRPGWTQEYLLSLDGEPVGYGSVASAGPWQGEPTAIEIYVAPPHRQRLLDLYAAFLRVSGAVKVEVQSNDVLATVMLHRHCPEVASEAILFHDGFATALDVPGAALRQATAEEEPDASPEQLRWRAVVEIDGQKAGSGGVLFHYNRPYGDIYMAVEEAFRRRGVGSLIVQELKRWCYQRGHIPAARCNVGNLASQRTLQKAGFVPCGHVLVGQVASDTLPSTVEDFVAAAARRTLGATEG